jgi:hypothetical protein
MTDLITRNDLLDISRKIKATGIAGALAIGIVTLLNNYYPTLGDAFGPAVEQILVLVIALIFGYITRERMPTNFTLSK